MLRVAARGPSEIWEYYERTIDAFKVLDAVLRSPPVLASIDSPYWRGLSPEEVESQLGEMTRELELEVSLALVASFEGIRRDDFKGRSRGHPLATRRKWPGLESAVKEWGRQSGGAVGSVQRFKRAIRFRNYLAHGRQFLEGVAIEFDPETVRGAALELQEAIPGFPRLV